MRIIRVFPRRTNTTPTDDLVRFNVPSFLDEADEVHISVTFTWDLPVAETLYNQWKYVAPTKIGGPATGMRGETFTPGLYVKHGCTITSRGCNNKCWFCSVWKRDGKLRELPIQPGYNILDDNLLACSEPHIRSVFSMLKQQKQQAIFTGGLEAKLLQDWHTKELEAINPKQLFFAYDTPDDLPHLQRAGQMLANSSISKNKLYCYVLIGYPKDTKESAIKRLTEAHGAGFMPFAMLYRDHNGLYDHSWRKLQRTFSRPAITRNFFKNLGSTLPYNPL